MVDLLFVLFEFICDPFTTWGRSGLFFRGLCGVVVGVLLLAIGTRAATIGGSLFLTMGIILILLGFARRESEIAASKRVKTAPTDTWKPPDSVDVNKIVRGD